MAGCALWQQQQMADSLGDLSDWVIVHRGMRGSAVIVCSCPEGKLGEVHQLREGPACDWERHQLSTGGIRRAYAGYNLFLKTCTHADDLNSFLRRGAPLQECEQIA
mmetsp:Transcript_89022/g.247337  ORF Transcript_89022/g.247337 Transcript_89022/m.247337 type:complete len:106 (-) Transcript_89022:162-479(-)